MKIRSRFSLVLALCGIGVLSAMADQACDEEQPLIASESAEARKDGSPAFNSSEDTVEEFVGGEKPPPVGKPFLQRYLVTYMGSDSKNTTRSATAVTVTNLSNAACEVQVTWYKGYKPDTPICTTKALIIPGATHDFCSRRIPGAITDCNSVCCPSLTLDEGKAIVSSRPSCEKIGVDSRVYYAVKDDANVSAVSNPNIVEIISQNSRSRQ
jgi:hypothetical protein